MTASMDAMEEEQGKGHVLEEFKDLQEVKSLIASLKNTYNDQVAREASCERFTCNVFTAMTQYLFIRPEFSHLNLLTRALTLHIDSVSKHMLREIEPF